MPDKMSAEKIALLRAYGAEVVVCPTAVAPEHPDSYYSVAKRLAAGDPRRVPARTSTPTRRTPRRTYASTGPGDLAADRGPGHALRRRHRHRRHDQRHRPLPQGAEPRRRRSSAPTPRARSTPAAAVGRTWSRASARTSGRTTYDPSIVDRVIDGVSDRDSFLTARRVTREEGILVGGSGGTAVPPRSRVGRELGPERRRRRADARLRPRLPVEDLQRRVDGRLRVPVAPSEPTVGDVLAAQGRRAAARSCTSTPTRRCAPRSRSCASST